MFVTNKCVLKHTNLHATPVWKDKNPLTSGLEVHSSNQSPDTVVKGCGKNYLLHVLLQVSNSKNKLQSLRSSCMMIKTLQVRNQFRIYHNSRDGCFQNLTNFHVRNKQNQNFIIKLSIHVWGSNLWPWDFKSNALTTQHWTKDQLSVVLRFYLYLLFDSMQVHIPITSLLKFFPRTQWFIFMVLWVWQHYNKHTHTICFPNLSYSAHNLKQTKAEVLNYSKQYRYWDIVFKL